MKRMLFASLFIVPLNLYAAARTATIVVDSGLEPASASGLLVSSSGVTEKSGAQVQRAPSGSLEVTFSFDDTGLPPDTYLSAIVRSSDGDVAYGTVRSIRAAENYSTPLPPCHLEVKVPENIEGQIGDLQKLFEIRSARKELMQQKLASLMVGDFLDTLRKLERGFGLTFAHELSPTLPAAELVDRLARIANSVKNYRSHRAKSAPAQTQ